MLFLLLQDESIEEVSLIVLRLRHMCSLSRSDALRRCIFWNVQAVVRLIAEMGYSVCAKAGAALFRTLPFPVSIKVRITILSLIE